MVTRAFVIAAEVTAGEEPEPRIQIVKELIRSDKCCQEPRAETCFGNYFASDNFKRSEKKKVYQGMRDMRDMREIRNKGSG